MTTKDVSTPTSAWAQRGFAPVLEEFDYPVEHIEGRLPAELTGTLYRIGPGKHQVGRSLLHNVFDGDGMVSQFVLNGSTVRFRNRYVRTEHFRHGLTSNRIRFRGVGTQIPGGALANIGRLPANVANTNIVHYAGGLLALWELGNPHRIDPDTLETLGRTDFDGRLGFLGAFSAHPKWDPGTGEMFNFGLDLLPTPRLRTYRVDRTGRVHPIRELPLFDRAWNHDFALTAKHLVFVLDPLVPNLRKLALGTHSFIDSLDFAPRRGTRFVLVPRSGAKPVVVDHDPLLHFHLTNAYEDGTDTVVDLVRYDADWADVRATTHQVNRESLDYQRMPATRLMRYRITPGGRVIEHELADTCVEFPQYDWRRSTHQHRYTYLSSMTPNAPTYNSITKVDTLTGLTTTCDLGTGAVGEPLFVPRGHHAGEDDGWLLALHHDITAHRSRLIVLDARDVEQGPLASAWLRHHIPFGFHGTFTRRIAQPGTPIPLPAP